MRTLLLLTLATVLLYGCGPVQPDADQVAAEKAARAEMEAGNYTTAAQRFEALAEASSGQLADRYRLSAAEAYSAAGEPTQTRRLLEVLEFNAEDEPLLFIRERLLEAKLALASEDIALARERLDNARPTANQPHLLAEYHRILAQIYEREGNAQAAVAELLAADQALAGQPERLQYAQSLWERLRQLERDDLIALRKDAGHAAAGWIDLALIERAQLTNADNLRRTLDDWQLQYPGHPAAQTVLPTLREFTSNLSQRHGQIALLLPFDSVYADVARSIRDGFIASWYQDSAERPELRIYDTGTTDIVNVYNQAVSDGAELVVGPLRKETLAALLEQGQISVPTLALNYYKGNPAVVQSINSDRLPSLYQFSLAPEDEARQVAERAWFDGHTRALALTPANEWGDRIYQAFLYRFEELGGEVLKRVNYVPGEHQQFANAVETLLSVDKSESRYREQRDQEHTAGLHQGADFIMLAGYPPAGRQVGPQLQFYYAGDMPVYSTSHIFDGVVDRYADADMNGFIFADMPWIIDPDRQHSTLYRTIERYWPDGMSSNPRLYAFGIDAYRLSSQLSRMAIDPRLQIDGASGQLTIAGDAHIHRGLQWARFVNGAPQPLGLSLKQPPEQSIAPAPQEPQPDPPMKPIQPMEQQVPTDDGTVQY